nr:1259_t:CDS:2 [Entrophospora candida]
MKAKSLSGVKPIITDEVASLVRSYALENTKKTQQEITDYVCKELNISISRPSITILLKKLGITRKKLTYHYNQLNEAKAKEFNESIKPLLTEYPFIAIDECSFYPNQDPRFGYSLKGTRARAKKPSSQGKHYTLLFAISNLKELKPIGSKKNILLMDNARIHIASNKRKENNLPSVKEQMANKNMEVLYITPYAPMLNPVELVFCLLRQQTEKNRPRNYEEMKSAIEKVVELLNTKDLRKYF